MRAALTPISTTVAWPISTRAQDICWEFLTANSGAPELHSRAGHLDLPAFAGNLEYVRREIVQHVLPLQICAEKTTHMIGDPRTFARRVRQLDPSDGLYRSVRFVRSLLINDDLDTSRVLRYAAVPQGSHAWLVGAFDTAAGTVTSRTRIWRNRTAIF